jgi:5'-nucleotidase
MAVRVIEQIAKQGDRSARLYNLNFPKTAMVRPTELRVVPMGVARWGETYEKRVDPRGRNYYWATNDPPAPLQGDVSDLTALRNGYATLTPLHFDLTRHPALAEMRDWKFELGE